MPLDFRSKSLLILRHAEAEHHLGACGSCLVPEDHSTTLAEWQHTQPDSDPRPADHSSGGREIWREETDIVLSVKECRVLEGGHINTLIYKNTQMLWHLGVQVCAESYSKHVPCSETKRWFPHQTRSQ